MDWGREWGGGACGLSLNTGNLPPVIIPFLLVNKLINLPTSYVIQLNAAECQQESTHANYGNLWRLVYFEMSTCVVIHCKHVY